MCLNKQTIEKNPAWTIFCVYLIICLFVILGILSKEWYDRNTKIKQLDKVIDRCEISIDNLSKDYIFQKCVSETYTYHYINDAKGKYDESKSYSNKQIYYNEYIFHYNKLLKDYREMKTKLQTRLPLCK